MSETSKAVFLSYASQDAESATRIADALRGAGIEVWFDQNELVGGDAWDQKIRKQIGSCALFVPIISASTQARAEGYFRLEWRLADKRTELMGRSKAYLLPVCIDETRDGDADVPDSFLAVQWTRLRGGEALPAFVARVVRLLENKESPRRDESRKEGATTPVAPRSPGTKSWLRFELVIAALVLLGGGAALWWRTARGAPAAITPSAGVEAEVARIRAGMRPDQWTRADFEAFLPSVERLAQANPDNGEVWALRSIAHSLLVIRNLDSGTKPLQEGKASAERAQRLAPGAPLVELARGMHLIAMISRGGDPRACRAPITAALAGLPRGETLGRYAELCSYWLGYQLDETDRCAKAWLQAAPSASFPMWILAQCNLVRRQREAAETWAERAAADPDVTGVRARVTQFEARYYLGADLAGSRQALDAIPESGRSVQRVVASRWLQAMAEHRYDLALQELARVPESMLSDRVFHGPKTLLAGFAHDAAGRKDTAQAQFREAERLLRPELASDPENLELHAVLALTLAAVGQGDEARRELGLVEPLLHGLAPSVYTGQVIALVAQARAVLGEPATLATWLRRLLGESASLPFTPASLVLDPRFSAALGALEPQALLKEFKELDRRKTNGSPTMTGSAADEKSIAVLPFSNMSEDEDANAFFADGIHEDILTDLAGIRELRVVSRTSVMDYRGTTKKIPQIGRELNVAYVLEGSVRRAGNKVRVTGQLIRTATDEHVWAKSFDRDLTDIFQIQAELAKAIAGELNAAISPQEQKQLAARPTENLAAYDLYLKSREIANSGAAGTRDELLKRERLLQSAVELDPKFLDAWCELVQAHVGLIAGSVDTTPARLAKATAALERARALAPDAPEVARATGAYQLFGMHDPVKAVMQFAQLVERYPNDTDNLTWLAVAQMLMGRWAEALATQRRLTELDPANRGAGMGYIFKLRYVRRYDDAITEARRMLALRPDDLGLHRAMGYMGYMANGSTALLEEALRRAEVINRDSPVAVQLRQARAYHDRDYPEYLRLDKLLPEGTNRGSFDAAVVSAVEAAALYRSLGDAAGARERLGNLPARLRAQLELEPNNTQHLRALAGAESILGNDAEALRLIDRAAAVLPESRDSRIGMNISVLRARILAWAGDKDQAIAEITRLLKVPSELNVHMMKASLDWLPLAKDPRFQALLDDPRNNAPLY